MQVSWYPLPPRERARAQAVLGNNIPSPPEREGQGTGSTAVSLFPLPPRERARAQAAQQYHYSLSPGGRGSGRGGRTGK